MERRSKGMAATSGSKNDNELNGKGIGVRTAFFQGLQDAEEGRRFAAKLSQEIKRRPILE